MNTARALSFTLLIALSASASGGQQRPSSADDPGSIGRTPDQQGSDATLEALPSAPKVTCNDDQLTISATNSTLASVLAAVHACTGVQIDIPAGIADIRVFDKLGPGPAREVLTSMLDAMNLNYVIGSSDANPDKVDSVLLIARVGDGSTNGIPDHPQSANRGAWAQSRQNRAAFAPEDNYSGTIESVSTAPVEEPAPLPVDNTPMAASPVAVEAAPARPDPPTATPIEGKTTADQITNMQQLFEQRRKMMQQLNSTKP